MTSSPQRRPAPGVLDLGIGHPDPRLLPASLVEWAVARALRDPEGALQYGAERGPAGFLEELASFLTHQTGVTTPAERLMVTGGTSQALDLVCTMFTEPGDVVLVEEPTYFLARGIFEDHGLEVVGVPVDHGGVDLELLDAAVGKRQPAFFYTIPFFQNPSGVSLTPGRRRGLLDIARKRELLVVSDEAYGLLAYAGAPQPALAAGDAPVLSLGSFSKIFAPGLRLGWVQGPPDRVERLAGSGWVQSGGGLNPFASAAVSELMASGRLTDWVATLRRRYRERGEALVDALIGHADGRYEVASVGPDATTGARVAGGYFAWVRVPGMDMAGALPVFHAAGVAYQPGRLFSSRGALADHARLCFAYYDESQLREAGERFARALEAAGFGR